MANSYSSYHITVNPNDGNVTTRDMRRIVEVMSDNVWDWLYKRVGGARVRFPRNEQRRIIHQRYRVGIENNGNQNHNTHAHILFQVTHRSQVVIDAAGLRALLRRHGYPNASVHIQWLSGDADIDNILQYLAKTVKRWV